MGARAVVLESPNQMSHDGWPPGAHRELNPEKSGDDRFRALMPLEEWDALPTAIRRRFSKRLAGGETVVYAGEVLETWMSRARLVARAGDPADRRSLAGSAKSACSERRDRDRGLGEWWTDLDADLRAPKWLPAGRAFMPSASPVRPDSRNMSATASAWR